MKSLNDIKQIVKKTKVKPTSEMRSKVLDEALQMQRDRNPQSTSDTYIWRIIMNSKATRYAAAAVLVISVLASITLLDKTVPAAYALEQTLAAMQKVDTVHMHCRDWYNKEFEIWIQLDPKTGIPEYCRAYWPKSKILNISTPVKSYQYREGTNYVQVSSGKLYTIGVAPAKLFEQLVLAAKTKHPDIKVQISNEIDAETGKNLIVAISDTPQESWKFVIDDETKLPIEVHCLRQANKMGALFKDVDKIEFGVELSPDMFKFEIPEGARVTDHDRNGRLLNDPKHGMIIKGMSEKQAYKKISTDYWKALIAGDVDAAKKISPVSPRMVKSSLLAELVEVGDPYVEPGCGIGKLVPCKLRYKDGSLKRWNLIVKLKKIKGKKALVIASFYSSPTDVK